MHQKIEQSVIRILNQQGKTVGTGFVVADQLAVTCAHVIKAAGSGIGQSVCVQFFTGASEQTAQVLTEGWAPPESDDVAFLQLASLPEGVIPMVLGTAKGIEDHHYRTLGFARLANYDTLWANDNIAGVVPAPNKQPMLQLKGNEIKHGMSGAPVLDTQTNRVVGIVSEFKDDNNARFAWATTSETLMALHPPIQLWPNDYGPEELHAYLDYLIAANQMLTLPDGHEVLLERIYVSLRADEMNATERQAEHEFYLQDVESLMQLAGGGITDQYAMFAAMRKVIARRPKMLMLEARNWARLFGEREQQLLSLAEVMQQHPCVVVLGDPGSGKTTLGKWLVLQFARTLRQDDDYVRVHATTVQPDAVDSQVLNLGPVRLPIFIRIADYVRARWDRVQGDIGLRLEHFLYHQYEHRNLPPGLTAEAMGALAKDYLAQGRALLVLDGLDEVGDPGQRRAVMNEVRRFIEAQTIARGPGAASGGNRVLLTSRIVGYQFQPLIHLPHYTIEDMNETAITAFCHAWMIHVAGIDDTSAATQARSLKDIIFDNAHLGVRTLAANPLLLTILAQVYWSSPKRALPTQRVTLFDEVARALYAQRENFWNQAGIPPLRLTRALAAVAAHIHTNELTGFAEEGTVREHLATVLGDSEQVEAVLTAARDVSGLLVARGEGIYGFLHRSLQEYFAAKHLANSPEQVTQNVAHRILDATWYEPVILAVGIVSQPRYPGSHHRLPAIFATLLDTPDPAGEFLPRRELLAATACAECERVPQGIGRRISGSLLELYVDRKSHDRTLSLREPIGRAFANLQNSPVRSEVESVLCTALQSADFERRYAAVDIIIEGKLNSAKIANTLVETWRTYSSPAASLLIALERTSEHQPTSFQSDFLPLRKAFAAEPLLWERISTNQKLQDIISTLYLPWNAGLRPDEINRDSPLTMQLLASLRHSRKVSIAKIQRDLIHVVGQLDAPLARDAALALSTLGNEDWIAICLTNADKKGEHIRSVIACLALLLERAHILATTLPYGPIFRISEYVIEMNMMQGQMGIVLARAIAKIRAANPRFVPEPEAESTVASTIDVMHKMARDIVHDVDRICNKVSNADQMRVLDSDGDFARASALDISSANDLDRALINAQKLAQYLRKIQDILADYVEPVVVPPDLVHMIDGAIVSVQAMQRLLKIAKPIARVWTALITRCMEQWPIVPQLQSSILEPYQITAETLVMLVADLTSQNDGQRARARQTLQIERYASAFSKSLIEQVAILAHAHTDQYQVGPLLNSALNAIKFDTPFWINDWIAQMSMEKNARQTAQTILSNIQNVTPETFKTILEALPHHNPSVNLALLSSLRSLAHRRQIPKDKQHSGLMRLLKWLDDETEPSTSCRIMEVLGHWPESSDSAYTALLSRLNLSMPEADHSVLYTTLSYVAIVMPPTI